MSQFFSMLNNQLNFTHSWKAFASKVAKITRQFRN